MITIDLNMILSIGAAVFGLGSLLVAMRTNRRWQSRCQALEASLAGVRREMEHVVSISMRRSVHQHANRQTRKAHRE